MADLQEDVVHTQLAPLCRQVVEMTSLSLLAAEVESRGSGFAASDAVDLPSCRLLDSGYVCLAQEGGLTLALPPASGRVSSHCLQAIHQ